MVLTARYNENGSIIADIAGEIFTIPDDQENRHRRMVSEWEALGNTIGLYEPPPPPVPVSVSARQFKLQLLAIGLLDLVEAWISSQDQAVQIAYANSGTFVRTEPMMQAGFSDLGFSPAQIDAFYVAAAAL